LRATCEALNGQRAARYLGNGQTMVSAQPFGLKKKTLGISDLMKFNT
jgi:hypothetical protein